MSKYFFVFVSFLSLAIRSIYSYHSWYIRDQARVFDLGFQIYKYHNLPIQGIPVVYTNSLLPGSLQAVLAAIPLYFSGGNPYSILLFVQLLNFISCLIIYKIFRYLFQNIDARLLFAFIILNPMNIIFSYGWNLSFIIIFSSISFLGLVKICFNKQSKMALFLILFPQLLMLQLNLQFAMIAVLIVILMLRKIIPIPSFKMLFVSVLPGIITMSPMIFNKLFTQKTLNTNWNMNGSIFSNVQFNFENLFSYFHILARFISYITGATTRNLGEHYIKNHPQIWMFFAIAMVGTAFIFCISFLFYFNKNNWKIFFKNPNLLSPFEKLDLAFIYLPIIATILFVFSVTPPTTHKLWSLFPFSFYPFFRVLSHKQAKMIFNIKPIFLKIYSHRFLLVSIYIFSTLVYSLHGASFLSSNFSEIMHDSKSFCKENSTDNKLNIYLKQTENNSKEYTMALICPYWNARY